MSYINSIAPDQPGHLHVLSWGWHCLLIKQCTLGLCGCKGWSWAALSAYGILLSRKKVKTSCLKKHWEDYMFQNELTWELVSQGCTLHSLLQESELCISSSQWPSHSVACTERNTQKAYSRTAREPFLAHKPISIFIGMSTPRKSSSNSQIHVFRYKQDIWINIYMNRSKSHQRVIIY